MNPGDKIAFEDCLWTVLSSNAAGVWLRSDGRAEIRCLAPERA